MNKERIVKLLLVVIICFALSACDMPESIPLPLPMMQKEPEPEVVAIPPQAVYTPVPVREIKKNIVEGITVNGKKIDCYKDSSVEDVKFALLSDVLWALGTEQDYHNKTDQYRFEWREKDCYCMRDSNVVMFGDEPREMDTEAFTYKGIELMYVPIESFCKALDIGLLYDSSNKMLYCTPASGDWVLPSGYTVPVIQHFAIGEERKASEYMSLDSLEEEFQYLSSNGYTYIWFEDLWNLENIEKPVILTFDESWSSHYKYLFPIVKKYYAKITMFIVPGNMDNTLSYETNSYISSENLIKMEASGLVSVQSKSMNNPKDFIQEEDYQIKSEVCEPRMFITRLTGKEPIAFAYPYGQYNDDVVNLVKENYRFGVLTASQELYSTGVNDQYMLPRYYPGHRIYFDKYSEFLETGVAEKVDLSVSTLQGESEFYNGLEVYY